MSGAPTPVTPGPAGPVLLGGHGIINPACGRSGTVGFIGADVNGLWMVSCWHVIVRAQGSSGPVPGAEPIFATPMQGLLLGVSDPMRGKPDLDCAAAIIDPTVNAIGSIERIGVPGAPVAPVRDMPVIKFGARSGLTRGLIADFGADWIRIELRPDALPSDFLTREGDSGALWVEEGSLRPVGLNRAGDVFGPPFALATPIDLVLQAVGVDFA